MSPVKFQKLYESGKRVASQYVTVVYAPGTGQVGYSTSRSIGTHVKRNYQRRRLKEAFRSISFDLSVNDLIIVARNNIVHLSFDALTKELARILKKI